MFDVLGLDQGLEQQAEEDAEMTDSVPEAEIEIPQTAQPNQRLIEAFFGGRGGTYQQSK